MQAESKAKKKTSFLSRFVEVASVLLSNKAIPTSANGRKSG